ncbi:glyoxylate/hydroxypyruvate reductase A [Rhodoferax sp. GW822-FHT02A01]|uniref:2-hydroxyacid dehydrogenase n=1 Tax=Rhodoferax sp. GW822-FHT02A01 TaxID=3141537 RepID=UPI00315CC5BC
MRISFCCTDTPAEPWLNDLGAALPGAEVSLWQPGAAAADYGVVWMPPQAFFDEQPQLRAAFNIGAGVDALLRLNVAPSTRLVRLDDAGMGAQMAEYVCHALIRHYRGFDRYDQQKSQAVWEQHEVLPRSAMPVGIMGLGVLGERVARAVAQFDFPVNGWSRSAKDIPCVRCFHGEQGLSDFLAASKVLVSVLPSTPQTRDLLNRGTLSRLQKGGYLINVARGVQVVEEDLLALIDEGHLAGAALDVFRTEPLPPMHPFWNHPRIRITPHIAALTLRSESIAQISAKIAALEAGRPVAGLVDRQRGY